MTVKTEQLNEQALIARAIKGDSNAYGALIKRYYQEVYRHALYFLRNRDQALDVSQEVFIRVHRHLKAFDNTRPFAAWLYHINRNLCRNMMKRKRSKILNFSDLPTFESAPAIFDDDAQTGQDKLEQHENHQSLWNAIKTLSIKEQEVLLLKDIEGLRYAEIAEILEIPLGSVMSRLYHARKKLARILKISEAKEV